MPRGSVILQSMLRLTMFVALALVACGDGPGEQEPIEGFDGHGTLETVTDAEARVDRTPVRAAAPKVEGVVEAASVRSVTADSSAMPTGLQHAAQIDEAAAACHGEFACGGSLIGRWRLSGVCVDADALAPRVTGCADLLESVRTTADDYVIEFTDATWTSSGWLTTTEVTNYTDTCLSFILGQPAGVDEAVCAGLAGADANCEVMPGRCRCEVTSSKPVHTTTDYRTNNGQIVGAESEPMDYCVQGNLLRIVDGARRLNFTRLD